MVYSVHRCDMFLIRIFTFQNLSILKESLSHLGQRLWNSIPSEIKSFSNLNAFSKIYG